MFQWLDGAATVSADSLRHCALEVRAGGSPRTLALRKPKQVEPITFDLTRPVIVDTLALDWLPDPSHLRLEITKVEGREGLVMNAPGPFPLKTRAALAFPRKDQQGRLLPGGAGFEVRLMQPKGTRLPIEFHQRQAPKPGALPQPIRKTIEDRIRNLRGQLPGAQPKQKLLIEQNLNEAEAVLWYDDFFKVVHGKARLHFRVLADLEGYQLELARTEPP